MEILWSPEALEDYNAWRASDTKTCIRINRLLQEIIELGPLTGTGHPERLKWELTGIYSRRINKKDRLLYRLQNGKLEIISCRTHYDDK